MPCVRVDRIATRQAGRHPAAYRCVWPATRGRRASPWVAFHWLGRHKLPPGTPKRTAGNVLFMFCRSWLARPMYLLSHCFCWRSLGDSNPCFRRGRGAPRRARFARIMIVDSIAKWIAIEPPNSNRWPQGRWLGTTLPFRSCSVKVLASPRNQISFDKSILQITGTFDDLRSPRRH